MHAPDAAPCMSRMCASLLEEEEPYMADPYVTIRERPFDFQGGGFEKKYSGPDICQKKYSSLHPNKKKIVWL